MSEFEEDLQIWLEYKANWKKGKLLHLDGYLIDIPDDLKHEPFEAIFGEKPDIKNYVLIKESPTCEPQPRPAISKLATLFNWIPNFVTRLVPAS